MTHRRTLPACVRRVHTPHDTPTRTTPHHAHDPPHTHTPHSSKDYAAEMSFYDVTCRSGDSWYSNYPEAEKPCSWYREMACQYGGDGAGPL